MNTKKSLFVATAALGSIAILTSGPAASASPQEAHTSDALSGSIHARRAQPADSGSSFGGPSVVYQDTINGGCVSGSTCITFNAANGPDGGTITFPPVPDDALPIFGFLYFQYLTVTGCSTDTIGDFANATVNGVNINTVPFVEIGCLNADACFAAVATHFYRVDVSSLFTTCDLNVATFELRGFGMGNDSDTNWVEGATLMVAYCSASSPSRDIILVEDPQVYAGGEGDDSPTITYSWTGFNATGGSASLVLGIGNGQNFSGGDPGDELVEFSTNSTPSTVLGTSGIDGLFDGDLCGPGPFGNGGFYDNTIIDVSSLVNAGDFAATFTITGQADCLDSNAAFLCVDSNSMASDCVPDACNKVSCFMLDFDVDDENQPLVHGQHLGDGGPEFDGGPAFPVTLTSFNSAGNDTAAILDSTNGPAVLDPDLLVGRGNILIAQRNPDLSECPPGSGVYCAPNDDEFGGTLRFDFPAAVTPTSVVLIDIDSTDGMSSVVLTDSSGAQRIYTVPGNWTGDIMRDGPPGWKTLDLTTLADQVGFAATATASEDAGFDAMDVLRIDIHLGGSGGVDDLFWCVTRVVEENPPSANRRNGMGMNRVNLTSVTLPMVSESWIANLDCRAFGTGLATLSVRQQAVSGLITPYGEQLISGPQFLRASQVFAGSVSSFTWAIPSDSALIGMSLHAQGLCRGDQIPLGPNMAHARRGLSNAIDLILGF